MIATPRGQIRGPWGPGRPFSSRPSEEEKGLSGVVSSPIPFPFETGHPWFVMRLETPCD